MPRVVLDTNVIVSTLISDGKPRELFRKGIEN
jgi:predicted nucleic acid-binding protein